MRRLSRRGEVAVETIAYTDTGSPVRVSLRYDAKDPYRVVAGLSVVGDSTEWMFSRDLLIDGIRQPTGIGDVRVYGFGDEVTLTLDNGESPLVLHLASPVVATFVSSMLYLVPSGSEDMGIIDQQVYEWMDGA